MIIPSYAGDSFALGLLLFYVIALKPLVHGYGSAPDDSGKRTAMEAFHKKLENNPMELIKEKSAWLEKVVTKEKYEQFCELINGLLAKNPDDRFNAKRAVNHDFFQNEKGYLRTMIAAHDTGVINLAKCK